jgi:hypothetical protein
LQRSEEWNSVEFSLMNTFRFDFFFTAMSLIAHEFWV